MKAGATGRPNPENSENEKPQNQRHPGAFDRPARSVRRQKSRLSPTRTAIRPPKIARSRRLDHHPHPQHSGIMVAMKRTVLALSLLWVLAGTAPASAAFLGENPPLGESFPNMTFLRVSVDVSRELPPGSGGSCLERPAECFVAPAAAGDGGEVSRPPAECCLRSQGSGRPELNQASSQPNECSRCSRRNDRNSRNAVWRSVTLLPAARR